MTSATNTSGALPASVDAMLELLTSRGYLAERSLATVTYLSLRMGRPLFLEGEAGVGKTEIAKVLSTTLGRRLIRLQCYEGLDVAAAVYEWNYAAQMIAIRVAEAEGAHDRERLEHDVFSERFLSASSNDVTRNTPFEPAPVTATRISELRFDTNTPTSA